jgi:polyhydroxyalkanoate synthesis regulator protein
MIQITKYASRRLYGPDPHAKDPQKKTYLGLEDVARLVRAGEQVVIYEYGNGKGRSVNITDEILLDVLKLQHIRAPALSTAELLELIRR